MLVFIVICLLSSIVLAQGIPIQQSSPLFGTAMTDAFENFARSGKIYEEDWVTQELSVEDLDEFVNNLNLAGKGLSEIVSAGYGELENGDIDYGVNVVQFSEEIIEEKDILKESLIRNEENICEYLFLKDNVFVYFVGPAEDNLNLFEFKDGETRFEWNSMKDGEKYVSDYCKHQSNF